MLLDNNYEIVVFILKHVFSMLHVHLYLWTKVYMYHHMALLYMYLLMLFINKTGYFVHALSQFSSILFFKVLTFRQFLNHQRILSLKFWQNQSKSDILISLMDLDLDWESFE